MSQFLATDKSAGEQVHVIWYVVDASGGRFCEEEKSYIQTLFTLNDGKTTLPVIVLLNKAEAVSKEDLDQLANAVRESLGSSVRGIFRTYAVKDPKTPALERCPICDEEGIVRRKVFYCDGDKSHVVSLVPVNELDAAIQLTASLMPETLRSCFVAAQSKDIDLKYNRYHHHTHHYLLNHRHLPPSGIICLKFAYDGVVQG